MTDRYERIRAALEMGPTQGPWQDIGPIGAGKLIKAPERLIAVVYGPNINPASEANARLIAACDPDTIRALLAERDELAKDAARYRWLRDANINTLPYDDHGIGPEFPCGDDLDAAIDAAMAKENSND